MEIELSDSGKITITIDSCKLFTIYNTTMIVINNINNIINACTYLGIFITPAIDYS